MTEQEKRTKLVEAMGWTNHVVDSVHTWMPPKYSEYHKTFARSEIYLPDPFTDERHCHALIKHLNKMGYDIVIGINASGRHDVDLHEGLKWLSHKQGDNWMHGVCELALKVIK